MKLESQHSVAQDQIGATERRSLLLEQKNIRLEQDVDTRKTIMAQEIASNQQLAASGNGVQASERTVTTLSVAILASLGMFGEPQTRQTLIGRIQERSPFLKGHKGDAVFFLGLYLICRRVLVVMVDKMVITMEVVELVVFWKLRIHRYNRGSRPSIWESSPKTLLSSMGAPMRM